jgi:hypothetical protein
MSLPPKAITQFAPLVYEFPYQTIFQGDQPYYPSSVDWFLNQVELNWGNDDSPYQPPPGQPFDQNQLTKALPAAYLQIPDDPTATSPIRQGNLSSALAYLYMRPVDGTSDLYDLQYWLFYPVRGRSTMRIMQGDNELDLDLLAPPGSPYQGAGEHQGDWKHIAVRVDDQGMIRGVYYAQHSGGFWCLPGDFALEGTQPIVYAARNTHSCFPSAGKFNQQNTAHTELGFTIALLEWTAQGEQWDCSMNPQQLTSTLPIWNEFAGKWGPVQQESIDPSTFDISGLPGWLQLVWSLLTPIIASIADQFIPNPEDGAATPQNQSPWINGDHGPIQNDPVPYDTGQSPSVAQNSSGYFIEVHQSQNNPTLFYNIGRITPESPQITWISNPGQQYTTGITPAVAMNDSGLFIEVHQSQNNPTLWYDTGQIDPTSGNITWLVQNQQYDNGITPNIAINNDGLFIEVHQSQNNPTLWYDTGRVDLSSGDVTWLVQHQQYDSGITPTVALNDSGLFIEMHQSQNNPTLWYDIGQVDPTSGNITWLIKDQQYGEGIAPAVALNNAGLFVEVHQSQNNPTLWYDIGNIDPATSAVTWIEQSYQYDTGLAPKVALPSDSNVAMEVHQAGSGDQLFCHSRLGWW